MLAGMEFTDVVRRRKMVRNYDPEPIDPAVVDRVLRNATRAPNAGFSQGWSFLVLDTPTDTERYWRACTEGGDSTVENPDEWLAGMMRAPVVILPCSSKAAYLRRYAEDDKGWTDLDESRWPMPFWHMDTAMAALLMLQTATDEGLGSCFIGVPTPRVQRVKDEFGIPPEWDPIGVVTIGRAAAGGAQGSPAKRPRKPMADVVHRSTW